MGLVELAALQQEKEHSLSSKLQVISQVPFDMGLSTPRSTGISSGEQQR